MLRSPFPIRSYGFRIPIVTYTMMLDLDPLVPLLLPRLLSFFFFLFLSWVPRLGSDGAEGEPSWLGCWWWRSGGV